MSLVIFILTIFVLPLTALLGMDQSVAVSGKITCHGKPATNVKVKLFDYDTFDMDDLMAEGYTDECGEFYLAGYTSEMTVIEPRLKIFHYCDSADVFGRMRSIALLCVLLAAASAIEWFGRDQSTAVRGKLICDGRPAVGVKVKLWDEDDADSDDLLEEGTTNSQGEFHLSGWTKEFTPIDPKLNIYHDCNDILPCQRKFTIKIENKYISSGKTPKMVYDAGVIQLAGIYPGESRDCLN